MRHPISYVQCKVFISYSLLMWVVYSVLVSKVKIILEGTTVIHTYLHIIRLKSILRTIYLSEFCLDLIMYTSSTAFFRVKIPSFV